MNHRTPDASLRLYARVAGAGYLVIIIAGIFAEFFVRSRLVVSGDPAATARNILASETLFRTGIAGDLLMLLADVVVALALFVVFREINRGLALLAAFLRLAQASVLGINLLNVYLPLLLLGRADYMSVFETEQLQALALLHLEAHGYGYLLGLVFFGLHCAVIGFLVLRSRYVPRILGILLFLASAGYLVDGFGRTLLASYEDHAAAFQLIVFIPAFIGELAFCLWLLLKGVDAGARPDLR